MSLIPAHTDSILERGDSGVGVWALQRGLNQRGSEVQILAEDGSFGPQTEQIVRNFQERQNLSVDGRFGSRSGERLTQILSGRLTVVLPDALIRSMVGNESNFELACVNWGVSGGVDCGIAQRRVFEGSYDDEAVVHRAFDPLYQFKLLANSLRERHDAFYGQTGATTHERAWRLAALNHNYPYGAKRIAEVGYGGLSSYWTTPQDWVLEIGSHFPSGRAVESPLQWCQHYALGNSNEAEPGAAVRYVTNWRV